MKTKIVVYSDDLQHGEFKKGDTGYIDGYVRGADDRPYAVVVFDKKEEVAMVPLNLIRVK